MMGWLGRAAAATALRGEEPRNRCARWTARWFARTPAVAAARFQGDGEPFPHHWCRFPEPWPTVDPADPGVRAALAAAVEELPATWREVIIARDAAGRAAADVDAQLGLSPRQQRAILNRARARLRELLADSLIGEPDREGDR